MHLCVLSWFWLFVTRWTVACQAPLSKGFSRQEYWSGLPFPLQGSSPSTLIKRTGAEAETPILWPPHAKSWLIGKDPDAGRDWGQEEKGITKDEVAGWHHGLDGCESEWTPEVGDGQGGLACCDSWGLKESDITERLNWTELNWTVFSNTTVLESPLTFYLR